ncbi:MAG: hypothetical protein ABI912_08155 [Actinomycetota bacterium]
MGEVGSAAAARIFASPAGVTAVTLTTPIAIDQHTALDLPLAGDKATVLASSVVARQQRDMPLGPPQAPYRVMLVRYRGALAWAIVWEGVTLTPIGPAPSSGGLVTAVRRLSGCKRAYIADALDGHYISELEWCP